MLQSLATVAVVLCLLLLVNCQENAVEEAKQAVVDANNAFSTALYETLIDEPGNLLVSPLSASAVMAMAWLGASDATARELAAGLHIPDNHIQVEQGFKAILTKLQSSTAVTLEIANKMYLQEGFHVKETYRKSTVENFRSDIEEVNFLNHTEEARTTINQWVEGKTHNKIQDMIRKGTLSSSVLMIALNAIYFKGDWKEPFDESNTASEPFHLTPSKTIPVSMMKREGHFSFGVVPELDSKILWLKYSGKNGNQQSQNAAQSMIVILPNEIDGLEKLEANISSLNVTELKGLTKYTETIVAFPKFKLQKTIPLEEKLKQLGIRKAFGTGADFSGITAGRIHIDKVLQKVFVEVTEKGTEAAASPSVPSTDSTATEQFKATHPFLFLIVDDTTDAILLMGRVADPSDE